MKLQDSHRAGDTGWHRLVGGWRDVLDDIRSLCRIFETLPDVCGCGHAPAHLVGTCPCCGHTAVDHVPTCSECDEQLARLRPAIDLLSVDTSRFFPILKDLLSRHEPAAFDAIREIERGIGSLSRSFQQLVLAEGRFRDDCRESHLHELKDAAGALRRDAESLNRIV